MKIQFNLTCDFPLKKTIFFHINDTDVYAQANGSSSNSSINNGFNGSNQASSQYGQPQTVPPVAPPPPFNAGNVSKCQSADTIRR